MTPAFPWDDWALAQGTVDARNEERRAAHGSDQIRPPARPQAASLTHCPNCLTDLDADGYCDGCSYLATIKRPA